MQTENWENTISSESSGRDVIRDLLKKRDLIFLLVKRDFAKEFKQTILGPLWFIIQPLFQTVVLLFVFGKIGKMGPAGLPLVSFYLAGTMMWGIFSENVLRTSETFRSNAAIFGKVYFPRLVVPVSMLLMSYLKLLVQISIFLVVYCIELASYGAFEPNLTILLVPVYFVFCSLCGVGIGLILCGLTTRYWDLRFMIQFAMQLLMFLSAVISPVFMISEGWMKTLVCLNPVSPFIEALRFALMGKNGGSFDPFWMTYGLLFAIIALFFGIFMFNRVERNFIDSI